METHRIHHAATGWLIASLIAVSTLLAQEPAPDSLGRKSVIATDSARAIPPVVTDTSISRQDTVSARKTSEDTLRLSPQTPAPESIAAVLAKAMPETIQPSAYTDRVYISKGTADEIKGIPGYFVMSPSPVGSSAVPIEYLNASAAELTVNGLPFPYNGIYRPYVIGTDLNTIPWEILNKIDWAPKSCCSEGLDFSLGRPLDSINRSDVEIERGPYGYQAANWRFFRPFGQKVYAYFTVGFKKSDGYLQNSDYDGYNVTGGISRKLRAGKLSLDVWRHRAKTGQGSFDFLTDQVSRQSRGIDRGEFRYKTRVKSPFYLYLTGLFQRSAQTTYGYVDQIKTKYDIGGGEVALNDSLPANTLGTSVRYFRLRLFGLPGRRPSVNVLQYMLKLDGRVAKLHYVLNAAYAWNGIDQGAFLPSVKLSYEPSPHFMPYVMVVRTRRIPDLYLLNFNDMVPGLDVRQVLSSYQFESNPRLSFPVTSAVLAGVESHNGKLESMLGLSLKRIVSQIDLSYSRDTSGNLIVTPMNFDDTFLELFAQAKVGLGLFSGEIWGAFRQWDKKVFADGLEKGPRAMGFARMSFLRQFFVPRLYLGGSLEIRVSSRRDYRSITTGLTDGFLAAFGRLEFRYKDFTFWLNDDNLTNATFITWWDYYESSRTVWWGFRWNFFD